MWLKMELDKAYLSLFFVLFSPKKKNAADARRTICETYDKNVIPIRTCVNWFKRLKNSDISDKERFGRPAAERGQIAEKWEKVMENR